jgi:cellulose synthase (UDP-forming)
MNHHTSSNTTLRSQEKFNLIHHNPILLSLLILLLLLSAIFYMMLLFNPLYRGDRLPYVLVIFAETYIVWQIIMVSWTILSGSYDPRDPNFYRTQSKLFDQDGKRLIEPETLEQDFGKILPLFLNGERIKVTLFITVYGEDIDVIERTAIAARDIIGQHATIILDDGESDEVRQLAKKVGVSYLRRTEHQGAKAGNINNGLRFTQNDFVAVFDADHIPKPLFLYQTLPYFYDKRVAFVQSPQIYHNLTNLISSGAGYAQSLFYRFICPGKNKFNAAFCVGTNVVFRRSALDDIGGMYDKSKSEDIWTSLRLHEQGWKTIFTPDELSAGEAPETIKAYFKQQQRWATGGLEILFHHNLILTKKLSFNQKLQYMWTAAFYLHGLATAALFFLPAIYIIFGMSPINSNLGFMHWFLVYGSFYGLQIIVASYTMRGFRSETLILSTVTFPIYLRALKNAFLRLPDKWHVTGQKNLDSSFNYIVPQLLLFIFLVLVDILGLISFYKNTTISLALGWNLINTYVFGYFIYFAYREQRKKQL